MVLIENSKTDDKKIYIKTSIQGKNISKSFNLKRKNYGESNLNEKIIIETKKELIDLEDADVDPVKIKKTIPGKKIKSVEVLVKIDSE